MFYTVTMVSIVQWCNGGGGFQTPPTKFRSFDKVEPDCKLCRKCLVFLFLLNLGRQHPNMFGKKAVKF